MSRIVRGGRYVRVADPLWSDPLDPAYAKDAGGRWNPPGAFGVLYLCADVATARANVARLLAGQPFTADDLEPSTAPVLVEVDLPGEAYADAVTPRGLRELGLPASYPRDSRGRPVPHARCQPIGARLYADGSPGVAARSAAPGAAGREELAWFALPDRLPPRRGTIRAFADWYL